MGLWGDLGWSFGSNVPLTVVIDTWKFHVDAHQIKDLPTEKPKHFWATIGQNLPKSFIRVMRNSRTCTCRRVWGLIFSPFYQNQNFMGFCQKNHKDPSYLLKMALYCPQGSGTLRQQLLMMHGIAWYCMVLHWIAWYCIVLHGITWYCMV